VAAAPATSSVDVFVNCPFDAEYRDTFRALIFAIFACGFRPRSARELDDSGQMRMDKLYSLIGACRYGIHDISRTELDPTYLLPRFNMPLELGIFMGAKHYGKPAQRKKRLLIFDTEQYRYQRFISDLAGMDIHIHEGQPERAITETRDWLVNVSRRQLPSGQRLVALYRRFLVDLPKLAAALDQDVVSATYVDFEKMLVGWLVNPPPVP
jgi:hypothetical protein